MALMKCEECGGTVSSKAATCPHCGAPVEISKEVGPNTVFYDGIAMDATKVIGEMARTDGKVKHALWDMCDEAGIPEDDKTISGFVYQIYELFENQYGYSPKKVDLIIPPSEEEILQREYERQQEIAKSSKSVASIPHCPTCGSTDITRQGIVGRAVTSALIGGLAPESRAQFRCNKCGYMW